MTDKHQRQWHVEEPTDREVQEAIRYLEPDPICRELEEDGGRLVISISIVILLLGALGFVWLYRL